MSAFGQTSFLFEESVSINVKSTIIKEVDYPATLTCVNTYEGYVLFIYADATLNTKELIIEMDDLEVYDMAIEHSDTVFFCGQVIENSVSKGVIGFFLIDDLLNSPGSMNVVMQKYFVSGTDSRLVERLTKLVTYNSTNGDRHIVCIGRCIGDLNTFYPCIVDMSGTLFVSMGYSSGYYASDKETFEDIKIVTNNYTDDPYIVTAGYYSFLGRYICFRVYDLDYVLYSPSGIEDTLHFLNSDTSGIRRWYDDGLSLSNVHRDHFSTVSYRNNTQSNTLNSNANIHIGTYSLVNLIGGSCNIMNESLEIPYTHTINRRMKDFIYNPTKNFMVFLHDSQDTNNQNIESYYCEIPERHSYIAGTFNFYNNRDVELHRLGLYNTRLEYIMSGIFKDYIFDVAYGMDTYGITERCSDYYKYNYFGTGILTTTKWYKPFNVFYGIDLSRGTVFETIASTILQKCPQNNN